MTTTDKRKLWKNLCDQAQWFDALHGTDFPDHRGMAVRALEELVTQFRDWELARPDYRPSNNRFDVAGVLHLLRFALTLAKEEEQAYLHRVETAREREISAAAFQGVWATHH